MLNLSIPEHIEPLRNKVLKFIEERIYPQEEALFETDRDGRAGTMRALMKEAKAQGLWALGHPEEIGGGGLPFMDYVFINEVVGRSAAATVALGTHSLQDSIMLHRYANDEWRDKYLKPLVAGEVFPSFGMTEPDVASSDPTQLQTRGELIGDEWVINGRKWFTSGAAQAGYTTVMCRTETGVPDHAAFSQIVVPTDTKGYDIVRDVKVMGEFEAFEGDFLPLAVLPALLLFDGYVDRVGVLFTSEPIVLFIGDDPGADAVDGFLIDEHPKADFFEALLLLDRNFAVGTWADIEEQVAAFSAGFDQH